MVSIFPLISSLLNPLGNFQSQPMTVCITVTLTFDSSKNSRQDQVFVSLFDFFQFHSVVSWNGKIYLIESFFIWFGLVLWHITTILGYLIPNPSLFIQRVLFQTIQFSISIQSECQKLFYFKQFSLA